MRVTGKSILWEGRFLRTALLDYEDKNGIARQWEIVERTTSEGVVIIAAITENNKAILIRQYRPALNAYIIELPAGLIEPDEKPSAACRRELIEETGYSSGEISTLSGGVISTGILAENWYAMLVMNASAATREAIKQYPPDETEDIEVLTVDMDSFYDELSAMQDRGELVDIRIYGILELARRRLASEGG